ncbi:MAG: Holliday junction resolvase RecU [Clostridia bacterium]|nr:Holliday junction resolvase RecU [Clostridia bacterium]
MRVPTLQANRGRALEEMVELTLDLYRKEGIAVVHKIPTPWVVRRKGGLITGAFPAKKSSVDFFGVWRGRAVAFDAKETSEKSRFPLKSVPDHQMAFLSDWKEAGGIAGVLVWFRRARRIFWVPAKTLTRAREAGKKSLALDELASGAGVEIPEGLPLDLERAWEKESPERKEQ